MGETLADLFEWQKPSVGWMSRYFGACFSSINSIFAWFCPTPPVLPYICHIKVANAPKHTTQVVLNLLQMFHIIHIYISNIFHKIGYKYLILRLFRLRSTTITVSLSTGKFIIKKEFEWKLALTLFTAIGTSIPNNLQA